MSLPPAEGFEEWTAASAGDHVTIRYTISDGEDKSVDVFLNGAKVRTTGLSAHWINTDMFFDDENFKLDKLIHSGDVLKLQSSAENQAGLGIDYILLEYFEPVLAALPAGFTNATN